jgi:23S rRNA (cytosine1962-C5)-methyltransferase
MSSHAILDHMGAPISQLLEIAFNKRSSFLDNNEDTNGFRLVNGEGDGLRGITIDKLGEIILVEVHKSNLTVAPILNSLPAIFQKTPPTFLKERWSARSGECKSYQVAGDQTPGTLIIEESNLSFALNICDGEHIGLFLDGRPARRRITELAAGRRVLNLFSYTGAFGVAAAKGQARSTTNIDNKKSALEKAKHNYSINGLESDTRTFLKADAFKYLARAVKGKTRYDLIILDPPPRLRRPGGRWFNANTGYGALAAKCLKLLVPSGTLMAGLNANCVDDRQFEAMLKQASLLANRSISIIEQIENDNDFPMSKDRPTARFSLLSV